MPLILRLIKGSKLTSSEMDNNMIWLSENISGSGVIPVTGSGIDASNTPITSSFFVGNGSQLTNITSSFISSSNVYGPLGNNSIASSSIAVTASYVTTASYAVTASYVSSSGYSLSSSLANTASYYNEVDPIFISKSASLATTGSNNFTGNQNISQGNYLLISGSLVHGFQNVINTNPFAYVHAQGLSTQANGTYSHAEGRFAIANGVGSHAEGGASGNSTIANGDGSHAEGFGTITHGSFSHAAGYYTVTSGSYSYAGGNQTFASGSYQTVVGQFNTRFDGASLFIVGNGTGISDNARKDAFKVTSNSTIMVATQSSAPGYAGIEGEIVPVSNGGNYFIYVYIGGQWRSSSLS